MLSNAQAGVAFDTGRVQNEPEKHMEMLHNRYGRGTQNVIAWFNITASNEHH